MELSKRIKVINESDNRMPYGFEDYDLDDIGYSDPNTHGYDMLKGTKEYFSMVLSEAEKNPFYFQGLKMGYMKQAVSRMEEAIKALDICWDMEDE